jgi:hypothetical protein
MFQNVEWIHVAQDKVQWLVSTEVKHQVSSRYIS